MNEAGLARPTIRPFVERARRRWRSDPRWFTWGLAAVVVLGATARLVWLAAVGGITLEGPTDQGNYAWMARAWADGKYWTGSYRSPGYPALVTVGQLLADVAPLTLRTVVGLGQLMIAVVTIVVVGLGTRRWYGPAAGLVAAGMLAAWPNQIAAPAVVMSEVASTPLLVLAAAALLWRPADEPPTRMCAVSAACACTAVMMRPVLLAPVVLLAALVGTSTSGDLRRRLLRAGAYLSVTAAMILTWSLLLSVRAERPVVSLGTSGDFNLCLGNNPAATGRWSDEALEKHCPWPIGDDEFDRAAELRDRTLAWMVDNPGRQPGLVRHRLATSLEHDHYWIDYLPEFEIYLGPGRRDELAHLLDRWWIAAMALTAACLVPAWSKNRRVSGWLVAIACSSLAIPALSVGDARYHDTMVPFMCVIMGAGIATGAAALWRGVGVRVARR